MNNIRVILICFFFLFIISVFNTDLVTAEPVILLEIEDPAGDDYGPGAYKYPGHEDFSEEGLFDIRCFSILDLGEQYEFNFLFEKINDPWHSKYGFSLPLIEIYIGKSGMGSSELFREGANIKLDYRYLWSTMLKISGWWVRAYRPEDRLTQEENFWDVENHPADIKNVVVAVEGNNIRVVIDKEVVGELQSSHFYILVGSYDPFGTDNYRDISKSPSPWYFLDTSNKNLEYAPRVLDIILPTGMDQKEVLGNFEDGYPVIVPIKVSNSSKTSLYILFVLAALILLVIAFFIMNNKTPLSNNK